MKYIASGVVGIALGIFYFGGLFWTTKKIVIAARPLFLVYTSFLIRTAIVCLAFFWIMDGSWQRLLVSFVGFFAVKLIFQVVLRRKGGKNEYQS